MNKIFVNGKALLYTTFSIVLCAFTVSLMHIKPEADLSLEHSFMIARDGYININEFQYSTDSLFCVLNLIVALPPIISFFTDDLNIAKSFVFIRIKDRNLWFLYKFLQSAFYSFFFSFIYNFTIYIVVFLMGFKAENPIGPIYYMLWGSVVGFLILFMLVILGDVLSFILKPHLSVGIIVGLTIMLLTSVCFFGRNQIQYHILANYFISWHTFYSANADCYPLDTWIYYMVIVVVISIELIIAKEIIKKKDFI